MKYYVLVYCNYSSCDIKEFDLKQDALECVAVNSGEDSYCRLIEGVEIPFKITQIAMEITHD